MSIDQIRSHFTQAREALETFLENEENFQNIQAGGDLILSSILQGNKIICCGNGGSMCDAMHLAEELTGRFRESRNPFPAIAISDPAYLTCTANDYGYEHVFSRYVKGVGLSNDILVAITTSGNSTNIINAAKTARKKGMKIIGLTGKDGGELAPLCDVEIRAPFSKYADRAQEIHIKVIHALIDYLEQNL